MKPRPTLSSFAIALRPKPALQCRRNTHIRPVLSYHIWQDASRIIGQQGIYTSQSRYASTAAKPSSRPPHSSYGREAPPPAKLRPNKINVTVPAKTQKPTTTLHAKPPTKPTPVPSTHLRSSPLSTRPNDRLNPPDFTYPPPLSVPSRQPSQSYPGYLWTAGKAYLAFYKASISNIRETAKLAKSLRSKSAGTSGASSDILTRAEWQIIQRSRKDMLRLPVFGLIFLVFGEWTPLLVMWITPVVPETCRIPRQVEKLLAKAERRRYERLRRLLPVLPAKAARYGEEELARLDVKSLSKSELLALSARFDAHSQIWDLVNITPPKSLLRWSVGRKVAYLRRDDELIRRDGGWEGLGEKEVRRVGVERGVDVLGRGERECREGVGGWFAGGK